MQVSFEALCESPSVTVFGEVVGLNRVSVRRTRSETWRSWSRRRRARAGTRSCSRNGENHRSVTCAESSSQCDYNVMCLCAGTPYSRTTCHWETVSFISQSMIWSTFTLGTWWPLEGILWKVLLSTLGFQLHLGQILFWYLKTIKRFDIWTIVAFLSKVQKTLFSQMI